jgi:predicted permease
MGVAFSTTTMTEQELYNSYPLWTFIASFVFFGLLVALITYEEKSKTCIYYFASCHHNTNDSPFFTNAKEVYGAGTEVMPILVIVCGVFLLWFSL